MYKVVKKQQPTRLARYNRAAILGLIRHYGPVSQAELADLSGLATSSVVNITRSLVRRGLVRAVGTGPSSGGRPPRLLEINAEAGFAIGVNVRLAGLESVLLDLAGDVVAESNVSVNAIDAPGIVATVCEAVDEVLRLASVDPGRVLGVGVGFPGLVRDGRSVVGTPEFPGWGKVALADDLEMALGMPVMLENNANLAALAEYRHGIGRERPVHSLLYVYADHGIGSGIVLDGRLWTGNSGFAGEFGHTVIDVNGPPCICGSHGCLESMASMAAIVRRATAVARLHGVEPPTTYRAVTEAVEEGDPIAINAVDEAMGYLAVGIVNLDRELRPDVVIVGGDLFKLGPDMYGRLNEILRKRPAFWDAEPVPIVLGPLGTHAPALGAGAVVLERFFGIPEFGSNGEEQALGFEPSFESTPLWPVNAEDSMVGRDGDVSIAWAGNLQPISARLRDGESVTITVEARLEGDSDGAGVKALLHWDRVPVFGGSWPSPKNSPMRVVGDENGTVTYAVTLAGLPIGKYEFAVHLLGANDVWVPGARERNARVEVLRRRPAPITSTLLDDHWREEEKAPKDVAVTP